MGGRRSYWTRKRTTQHGQTDGWPWREVVVQTAHVNDKDKVPQTRLDCALHDCRSPPSSVRGMAVCMMTHHHPDPNSNTTKRPRALTRHRARPRHNRVCCLDIQPMSPPHATHQRCLANASRTVMPLSTSSLTRSSAATSFGSSSTTSSSRSCGMTTTPSTGSAKTMSPCPGRVGSRTATRGTRYEHGNSPASPRCPAPQSARPSPTVWPPCRPRPSTSPNSIPIHVSQVSSLCAASWAEGRRSIPGARARAAPSGRVCGLRQRRRARPASSSATP